MFRKIIFNNKYFLTAFLLWIIAGACILAMHTRDEIFFAINGLHNSFFDKLMTALSAYGRGDTVTIVFVLLLILPFYRNKKYIATTGLFGLTLPLINYFSKDFFSKPRPLGEYKAELVHTVPWLENLFFDSFPSGHTMGAFGFFLLLHHFLPKKNLLISACFFLLAFGCAYSRIYLGQHFFADIFAGSIIGTMSGLLIIMVVELFLNKKEIHA